MADILKQSYDLLDLKVSLETSGKTPVVFCELEATREGTTRRLNSWHFPPSAFNLPDGITPERSRQGTGTFRLPEGFGTQLSTQLQNVTGPLWLHLVRPYGYLGLIPWERFLKDLYWLPILRLPEFVVDPPLETPRTLDVILWVSRPIADEAFDVMGAVQRILRDVPKFVPRRVRFHVFTDTLFQDPLKSQLAAEQPARGQVVIYSAEGAPEEIPWFEWMLKSLKGRSIDLVHFVGHGYFSREWPALVVAESPLLNRAERQACFVGPAQLNKFLTQVGAWAFACSSPRENYSELGLRHLADTLAQLRPGAVVFHDLGHDSGAVDLLEAFRFLFSPPPQRPGIMPNVFLYCQPYQLGQKQVRPVSEGSAFHSVLSHATPQEVLDVFQNEENVPSWLAAAQRYMEECNWKIQQLEGEGGESSGSGRQGEQIRGARKALEQLQGLIAQILQQKPGGPP